MQTARFSSLRDQTAVRVDLSGIEEMKGEDLVALYGTGKDNLRKFEEFKKSGTKLY